MLDNGSTTTRAYNGNGDPLSLPYLSSVYAASFDPEDRLTFANQGLLSALYDGDGLRAWSDNGPGSPVTNAPTYYLYDGDQPVAEEAYTSEDLFFTLMGATGLEGRYRTYAGAEGDDTQIAYSAYTYDPQGNLVQPVSLYPSGANGPGVTVQTSSAYDGFGGYMGHAAQGSYDQFDPIGIRRSVWVLSRLDGAVFADAPVLRPEGRSVREPRSDWVWRRDQSLRVYGQQSGQ